MKSKLLGTSFVIVLALALVLLLSIGAAAGSYPWKQISGSMGNATVDSTALDSARNILYAGTDGSGVWRCNSPAVNPTWTQISGVANIANSRVNVLCYDPARNLLFVGTNGHGVWMLASPESSSSWVKISTLANVESFNIRSLAFDSVRKILYAGDETAPGLYGHGPWRCVDPQGARIWSIISSGRLNPADPSTDTAEVQILSFYYDAPRNILFGGTYALGVLRCLNPDTAPAWSYCVTSGDQPSWVGTLEYDSSRDILYAGWSTGGVWRLNTPAGNAVATDISNGLDMSAHNIVPGDLAFDSSTDTLYASIWKFATTQAYGVWSCPKPDTAPLWENTGGDVSTFKVNALTLDNNNSKLYGGAKDHGEWSTTLSKSFLAEGTSAWGFKTYISIENPNAAQCTARITYNTGSGPVAAPDVVLPANSQATVNPELIVPNQDFSTTVTCKEGMTLAVDRTMTWTGTNAKSPEGHCSISVPAPALTWYLPEGSTAWGFECWLLIQNPSAIDANCKVTYMTEHDGAIVLNHVVKAGTRQTFDVSKDIGAKDSSIKVEANVPVIPERAMYKNQRREGHDSIGTIAPATDYYLAEGTTAWGFTTYVLVQNPNSTPTDVTVSYMTSSGPLMQPVFTMPANSRKTIRVNDIKPSAGYPIDVSNVDLSTMVHGTLPIIAERAMYWGADSTLGEACHDSIGMDSSHTTFYLPDGQTDQGHETWTLVQNPNDSDVTVTISYLTATGAGNVSWDEVIPAESRRTFSMIQKGINGRAAVMVTSKTAGKKIMVERAMYWNTRGAGTDTIGGFSD